MSDDYLFRRYQPFFKYKKKCIQNCNSTYRSDSNTKDFNIIVKSECAMYEDDRPTNE